MLETTASLYRVPHVRFEADCVYTNNPITGAMRGYGNPQSTFFVETMMDRLAEALAMDPIAFRLLNANLPNEETPQGLRITSCGLRECLMAVGARADPGTPPPGEGPSASRRGQPGASHLRRGVGVAATLDGGGRARLFRRHGWG